MKKLLLLASICLLASCSNPTSKKFNDESMTEDLKAIKKSKKWSNEDATLFAGWLIKSKVNGESLEDKTYQQILNEAKSFKSEQEELALKAKKEEKEKKDKMRKAITVTMYEKEYIPQNIEAGRFEEYNTFKYAIQNNTNKEIKAIGLSFTLYNALGEEIGEGYEMNFTDNRIAPNGTYKGEVGFSANQYDNASNTLKNAKFEDLTFDFDISKIVYSDGSVLE